MMHSSSKPTVLRIMEINVKYVKTMNDAGQYNLGEGNLRNSSTILTLLEYLIFDNPNKAGLFEGSFFLDH